MYYIGVSSRYPLKRVALATCLAAVIANHPGVMVNSDLLKLLLLLFIKTIYTIFYIINVKWSNLYVESFMWLYKYLNEIIDKSFCTNAG